MLDTLSQAIALTFRPDIFLLMAVGLLAGMFVGAMPGLTATMAVAVLLPISFHIEPLLGIPFLIAVVKGGIYGGSIPAILMNIPGTGAAIATTFDGNPLAKQGKARKALELALFCSVIGDTASDIITILLIGFIAALALLIGPPELMAIVVFSLVLIASVGVGTTVKGGISAVLGLLFALVGHDPMSAASRFTFGVFELSKGIELLPMVIGLFAVPEILVALESKAITFVSGQTELSKGEERLTWAEFRGCLRTIIRSIFIGTGIGAVPGVGSVPAAFVAYAAARRASPHPERFGKGELEGVAAPETANNAVNGPTMVPLLTLGIPGDNITAILLGAFMAHGLRPGPQMFQEQGPLVYAILILMLMANVLFIGLGYIFLPYFARIINIRKSALLPIIAAFAFVGAYANSSLFDLKVMLFFGGLGYFMRKMQFDLGPFIIAFVLQPVLETTFGQTLLYAKGHLLWFLFVRRPIAAAFLVMTGLVILLALIRERRRRQGNSRVDVGEI